MIKQVITNNFIGIRVIFSAYFSIIQKSVRQQQIDAKCANKGDNK